QCSPQIERDILLQAHKTDSQWAPHLLCSFQTSTQLNLIMDYAEGGNLWDVLESSPLDGRVKEADAMWWAPQLVSAIHWCHSQGFVHRDIKPHNFVLTPDAHVLLIDFGSAAPLLPPDVSGAQKLLKRYCLIPCGTCDYISPEILQAHEEALVALEMEDGDTSRLPDTQGYGRETDWWSLGAMLYEMVYGCAPFFAKDIRQTYMRIMDHEITDQLLYSEQAPPDLHLPQFTYTEPAKLAPSPAPAGYQSHPEESYSQGFAFSALFQSSNASSSPGLSLLRSKSSPDPPRPLEEDATASFIGFSWGPGLDAFSMQEHHDESVEEHTLSYMNTPQALRIPSTYLTPNPGYITPRFSAHPTPQNGSDRFTTPVRPSTLPLPATLRTGTIRRTGQRRTVTDREAMKQLVDCVGMSARKKVLESGRKPRLLTRSMSTSRTLTRKELRFTSGATPIPGPVLTNTPTQGAKVSSLHTRVLIPPKPILINHNPPAWSGSEDTDSEGPPSPSPTPRPGSAMSTFSRRSATPTVSSRLGMLGTMSSTSTMLLGVPNGASGHSLSFSRSMDLTESFRSSLAEDQGELDDRTVTMSMSSRTFTDMEARLASILGDIRGVEEQLVRVVNMIRG
ncbi:hypothetical protein C0991_007647, partial [Blastosporella zonata]